MAKTDPAATARELRVLTDHYLRGELAAGVTCRPIATSDWPAIYEPLAEEIFGPAPQDASGALTAERAAEIEQLGALFTTDHLRHFVVLEHQDQVVGCYRGDQQRGGRYHMQVTIIRPPFQRRGVYTALLARVIAFVRAAGFAEIRSHHHADNSAVLIPKLKAGFFLTGFRIHAEFGLLVELRYCVDDGVRDLYAARIDPHRGR